MKVLTIVGARPQFVKAGVVSRALADEVEIDEVVVHTGQHFDENMSKIFFDQLGLTKPGYDLGIHGGGHGEMTGRMLSAIETVIQSETPDRVLVYGDTNSTLAGALAAAKLHVPVAHVEAGLRSFNMKMPEEVNRILTDQISDILFCPTQTAMNNLSEEGFRKKPVQLLNVGDVMQDSALYYAQFAAQPDAVELPEDFILATIHRAENTDDQSRLAGIVAAINQLHSELAPVVLPLHPRTRQLLVKYDLRLDAMTIPPVGYLEMLWLLQRCGLVLTDSGGVQKESFFFGKYCITLRDQTEWLELIGIDANTLVGANRSKIVDAAQARFGDIVSDERQIYGGGTAAGKIASCLAST